jgi:nudix-type nucleoside diphosphatase (YffH/AdpP family)
LNTRDDRPEFQDFPDHRVEISQERYLLDDFLRVKEGVLRHRLRSGAMSGQLRRLSLERGDAVAAILVDRVERTIILVEQFRYPVYAPPARDGWIVEAVAGGIDSGETAEQAIRREISEETGYEANAVEHIATFFVSPGGSSEQISLFYAEVRTAMRQQKGGGVAAEGEDIRLVELPLDQLASTLPTIRDAKTLIGLMWLLAKEQEPGGKEQERG